MGFVQKKDEKDYVDGIEVIGRGEGPDPELEPVIDCDIVPGQTAEDISGTTAARNADMETEADPDLLDEAAVEAEPPAADVADAADEDADLGVDSYEDEVPGAEEAYDEDCSDEDDAEADEDAEPADAGEPASDDPSAFTGKRHAVIFAIVALIAVIAAAVIGYAFGSGSFGAPKGAGSASVTDEQLDATVASWTFDGATHEITVREAIESQYSLDAAKKDDDTYDVPSAEAVLSYVRNQVLVADAQKRGLEISDEELASYASEAMGTDDFAAIAEQFSVSEEQAKQILREQSLIQKLYKEKAPAAPELPEQPVAPADEAAAATPTKEYASYIIELAGDEWDAKAGTWAKEDGVVATALAGQEFSADAATYEQAQMAFYAAYEANYQRVQEAQQEWTAYVNTLFANAQVKLYGIFA